MHKNKLFFFLIIGVKCLYANAPTFSIQELWQVVMTYHPGAKNTQKENKIADAERTKSFSLLDPTLQAGRKTKSLLDTEYYTMQFAEVKIPTWYGISLAAGMENAQGERLSNEQTKGTVSYVSAQVELIKGLIIDEERAAVKKSKINQKLTEQEQKNTLNNLLYESAKAYFNWYNYHRQRSIVAEIILRNEQRTALVKKSYLQGDRPAIDTLEAVIQWRSWQIEQQKIQQNYQNARYELRNFLWNEKEENVDLPSDVEPAGFLQSPKLLADLLPLINDHPKIRSAQQKLELLKVDKKLAAQYFLPQLSFEYKLLNKGYSFVAIENGQLNALGNQYYGVKFKMPLLFFKARGEYQKARLKVDIQRNNNQLLTAQLYNQLLAYYNDFNSLTAQYQTQIVLANHTEALYRAEIRRFQAGESSLFLLNSRESKWLETQVKTIELEFKQYKALLALDYALGKLPDQLNNNVE